MEHWKTIDGFPAYSISDGGNVRRDTPTRGFGSRSAIGRVLRQKHCADGYRTVSLYPDQGRQRQMLVHRLVCRAFIGIPPDGCNVNHKNGDKADNRLENLEYVTFSENILHAYRIGKAKGRFGEENLASVLTLETARAIRILHEEHGWSKHSITRAFGLDSSRVLKILRYEIWRETVETLQLPGSIA